MNFPITREKLQMFDYRSVSKLVALKGN